MVSVLANSSFPPFSDIIGGSMQQAFTEHIVNMLNHCTNFVNNNPRLKGDVDKVNIKGDQSIEMDIALEKVILDYIQKYNLPFAVFSEENGYINLNNTPKYLLALDPLDGSTNYKLGKDLLPFGTFMSIYNMESPKISEVLFAGAVEYTHNLLWYFDGVVTKDINNNNVNLANNWIFSKTLPVYLDLYYKIGYEIYNKLAGEVFIRNSGSIIGNLSYVLSNSAAVLGGVCVRPEEVGAVYALIKGAGGVAYIDNNEKNLDKFNTEKTYSILAGSELSTQKIVTLLV